MNSDESDHDDDRIRRAELCVSLYSREMERARELELIEWKANFGIWTLLAATTYLFVDKGKDPGLSWAVLWGILLVALHVGALVKLTCSENFSKNQARHYRTEALKLIQVSDLEPPRKNRGAQNSDSDEEESEWSSRSTWWVTIEAGMTAVLATAAIALVT